MIICGGPGGRGAGKRDAGVGRASGRGLEQKMVQNDDLQGPGVRKKIGKSLIQIPARCFEGKPE